MSRGSSAEEDAVSQENVRIVNGVYDAFGKGDVEAVLAQMDRAIEWNEAEHFPYADGNPYVGPRAILEGFSRV
jgi:uncharacterized protein